MFLDLASTVVGGILVLAGEIVAVYLLMIWAITPRKKKEKKISCPFVPDITCSTECKNYAFCVEERGAHFEKFI